MELETEVLGTISLIDTAAAAVSRCQETSLKQSFFVAVEACQAMSNRCAKRLRKWHTWMISWIRCQSHKNFF